MNRIVCMYGFTFALKHFVQRAFICCRWLFGCYVTLICALGGRVLVQHIPLTVQSCLLPCYLVTLVLPVGLGCLFLAVATRRRIRSTSRALHRREALSNALQ